VAIAAHWEAYLYELLPRNSVTVTKAVGFKGKGKLLA
jgi:hypothetical protein